MVRKNIVRATPMFVLDRTLILVKDSLLLCSEQARFFISVCAFHLVSLTVLSTSRGTQD
jgi:hypothetical protein